MSHAGPYLGDVSESEEEGVSRARCPNGYGLVCAHVAYSAGELAAHLTLVHRWPASKSFDKAREMFRCSPAVSAVSAPPPGNGMAQ